MFCLNKGVGIYALNIKYVCVCVCVCVCVSECVCVCVCMHMRTYILHMYACIHVSIIICKQCVYVPYCLLPA